MALSHPPLIPYYPAGASLVAEVHQELLSRNVILQQLKSNLHAVNNRMKQAADAKWRDVEFQIGDSVYLKLHPYRQHTVFRRASQKLANRYYRQYKIEARIGKLAYKLTLPEGSEVHPVFHVSMLKKHVGADTNTGTETLPVTSEGD